LGADGLQFARKRHQRPETGWSECRWRIARFVLPAETEDLAGGIVVGNGGVVIFAVIEQTGRHPGLKSLLKTPAVEVAEVKYRMPASTGGKSTAPTDMHQQPLFTVSSRPPALRAAPGIPR
jgi:hypothetical protein